MSMPMRRPVHGEWRENEETCFCVHILHSFSYLPFYFLFTRLMQFHAVFVRLSFSYFYFYFGFYIFFVPQNWHTSFAWTNFRMFGIYTIITQNGCCSNTLLLVVCYVWCWRMKTIAWHNFFLTRFTRILEWQWVHAKSHLLFTHMYWYENRIFIFKPIKCTAKC